AGHARGRRARRRPRRPRLDLPRREYLPAGGIPLWKRRPCPGGSRRRAEALSRSRDGRILHRPAGYWRKGLDAKVTVLLNILAIPGSLRAASINAAFCRAASRLAPAPLRISVFAGLGDLPLFNADLEDDPPRAVREFREAVGAAGAV